MPLLGAIGNASEYSFRGTYDNYPFDIDFGNLTDVEPGQIYTTSLKLVEDINYKVPISIAGDGEYYVGSVTFDKTFDNNYITFDQTPTTFDTTFPELEYSTQPTYVRNGNTVGLRVFGVLPKILNNNLTIVDRSLTEYDVSLVGNISLGLRSGDYSIFPNGEIQFDNRTFQGDEVGTEYYGKTYSTTITIGKRDFTWTITTKSAGSAQNLSFSNVNDINYSTEIVSNTYTVEGLTDIFDYTASITSNEGLLSVNYGEFVSSSPIKNGDILRLKLTSSPLNQTSKSTTIRIALTSDPTVGSISTTWSVTTLDSIPSNLTFTPNLNAELRSQIISDPIIISGLSNNINFDISITSIDGFLSINGGAFVKTATIRNGDQLQLSVNTSSIWLDEKYIVVRLANTSATWIVANRNIQANADPNASNLIFAYPLSAYTVKDYFATSITTANLTNDIYSHPRDVSPEVRLKSGLNSGAESSTFASQWTTAQYSNEQSRYYITSHKPKTGEPTNGSGSFFEATTQNLDALGFANFTFEMWLWTDSFNFSGTPGYALCRPPYFDTSSPNDYVPIIYLKGDNWVNTAQFRRGILVGYVNPTTRASITIAETTFQVLNANSWNHIAVTRSGSTFFIWVNGVLRASGSALIDFTGYRYGFARTDGLRNLSNQNTYIQDLRLYKGISKYTGSFNTNTAVGSIMEQYTP